MITLELHWSTWICIAILLVCAGGQIEKAMSAILRKAQEK